ncbi:hypothetical protein [Streptomyces cinnamoneus]|uniref:hypothetical protein n=1 Tax=Streptomyces cinnamoneus TaxID=53446 RepID=UPI00379CC41F
MKRTLTVSALTVLLATASSVSAQAAAPGPANMSLGGGYSRQLNRAVDAAVRAGITYVVAPGNEVEDVIVTVGDDLPS